MIPDPVLRLAVERGVITQDQAQHLRMLAREVDTRDFAPAEDQEKLRFIAGFGDIFVVIGIVLFMGAAGYFLNASAGVTGLCVGLCALSWMLAELFSRYRRMAFPSIVLLGGFTVSAFFAIALLLFRIFGEKLPLLGSMNLTDRPGITGLSALATGALVWLHYQRFHVPITVAAGCGALALSAFAFLAALVPGMMAALGPWIVFAAGVALFLLAMRYDRSDLRRETRRTDIAFWLHLLSAPMLVHSFVMAVFGSVTGASMSQATGLLAVFAVLALLALLIDRRAILVSALIYAGFAFGTLFRVTALADASVPATLLVLGGAVLALSAGWQPLRRALLVLMPQSLRATLPPATSRTQT
jgi:hypothetical protein